jgi:hypothetical protein
VWTATILLVGSGQAVNFEDRESRTEGKDNTNLRSGIGLFVMAGFGTL